MKFSYARGVMLALGLTCGSALPAHAQEAGGYLPSLLPIPAQGQEYGVQQTAAFRRFRAQEAIPPAPNGGAELPPPPPTVDPVYGEPPLADPYEAARGGAWAEGPLLDNGYGCTTGDCGTGGCAYFPCGDCSCWWVGANFLWMGRDDEDHRQLSFDDTNLVGSVLSSDSAQMNFSPGFEVSLGRWFACGAWGLEAKYWGVFPDTQESTVLATSLAGNLNSALDFSPLNIGATNVNDLYDAADAHRLRRSYQFHNIELNWLEGHRYDFGRRLNVGLIAGVRYFRFDEGMQYASADGDPVFGVDPSNEGYYDIDVENNLIGVQIGANALYNVGRRVRLRATPKVGVYNNYISHMQRIYNVDGTAEVGLGNPTAGMLYNVHSSKDDISFLAEIDLGLDYRLSQHWTMNVGYRAVAVTGVGMAMSQIPTHFADIPGVQDVDSTDSLLLHGGYIGATYSW